MSFKSGDILKFDTFHSAYWNVVNDVMNCGKRVGSRNGETRELINYTFSIRDPRYRTVSYPARKADYGFAVGEFLWYMSASNELEPMLYYNKRMGSFSDDGKTLNSAYGNRMFPVQRNTVFGFTVHSLQGQWETVVRELTADPLSRRAIITIMKRDDVDNAVSYGSKDVPCTLTMQFLLRNGRLDMIINMRSNDVIWGLTYDVFSFTLFHEVMAMTLGVEMGNYHHHAGSMHIYDRHYEMADQIIREGRRGALSFRDTDEMGSRILPGQLESLASLERELRQGQIPVTVDFQDTQDYRQKFPGGSSVRWMADRLVEHRRKRDGEKDSGPKET